MQKLLNGLKENLTELKNTFNNFQTPVATLENKVKNNSLQQDLINIRNAIY